MVRTIFHNTSSVGTNCVAFCNARLRCMGKWTYCCPIYGHISHSSSVCYGRQPLLNQREDPSANNIYGPSTVDAALPSASISQSLVGALAVSRQLMTTHTLVHTEIHVRIPESACVLGDVGAGIQVTTNMLLCWGPRRALCAYGIAPTTIIFRWYRMSKHLECNCSVPTWHDHGAPHCKFNSVVYLSIPHCIYV